MKQKLLLMMLTLELLSISVSAQTKNQPATLKSNSEVSKTREVGSDGFIWYKLKKGDLYGVQDIEGNVIIPISYDYVQYETGIGRVRYFYVFSGDFKGVYTRLGKLIISTEKHYTFVCAGQSDVEDELFWEAKRNDGSKIVLNAKGEEVFSTDKYFGVDLTCGYDYPYNKNPNLGYFRVYSSDLKRGIVGLDGKVICPPIYKSCDIRNKGDLLELVFEKSQNSGTEYKEIDYWGSLLATIGDYTSFDGLVDNDYRSKKSSSSSSSSLSSGSSSSSTTTSNTSSNNTNTGSGTQTIVVEHHRDPVPMQQWQACFACGGMGTMGCDGCGGSGTKYIGDRLHRCSRCNGRGIIPCNVCFGNKGQYITVYR